MLDNFVMHQLSTHIKTDMETRTAADARSEFHQQGLTIAQWAKQHGFSAGIVYSVLSGRRKCLRGVSHNVAVALGLKGGKATTKVSVGRLSEGGQMT
jgi:gp16 family phage-associated protein